MATYRRPATPAQRARADAGREEKLAALHDRLREQVDALRSGEDWKQWLSVAARLHQYSWRNTMLILAQAPDAQLVAGYTAWQQLGRQVTKGEKGISILAPVTRRREQTGADTTTDTTHAGAPTGGPTGAKGRGRGEPQVERTDGPPRHGEEAGRRSIVGWRPTYVWDISQTSGEPLPQQPRPQLLAGTAPPQLWDALSAQVAEAGYTLERGECGAANGRTDFGARTVRIRPDVDDAQAAKTLAHELGHVLLHAPNLETPPAGGPAGESAPLCRGAIEVEAESVAYLVCTAAGMDTDDYSFPYVAGWADQAARSSAHPGPEGPEGAVAEGVREVVEGTAGRVLGTARTILAALEPLVDEHAGTLADRLAVRAEAGAERAEQVRDRAQVSAARADRARADSQPGAMAGAGRERLLALHAAASEYYRAQLIGAGPDGAGAPDTAAGPREYLIARGLGHVLDPGDPVGAGYAPPGWTGLCDHLRGAGYTDPELLDAGVGLRTRKGTVVDRFRDRIMLPIREPAGAVIAFIGRAPDPAPDPATGPGADTALVAASDRGGGPAKRDAPRYLNSPSTDLYTKGEHLFGWDGAAERSDLRGRRVVLVEGPLDALAVTAATPDIRAFAPCGTALTPHQIAILTGHGAAEVVVAFDADTAGRAAAARAHDLLAGHILTLLAAGLPDGQDPAQLAETCPAQLAQALTDPAQLHPLADVAIDHAIHSARAGADRAGGARPETGGGLSAEAAAAVLSAAATKVATLPADQIARQIGRVAAALDVPLDLVNALVLDAVTATAEVEEAAAGRVWARADHLSAGPAIGGPAALRPASSGPHPAALAAAAAPRALSTPGARPGAATAAPQQPRPPQRRTAPAGRPHR